MELSEGLQFTTTRHSYVKVEWGEPVSLWQSGRIATFFRKNIKIVIQLSNLQFQYTYLAE